MQFRWIALAAVLLTVSCISLPDRYASIECNCSAEPAPVYRVFIQAHTGNWGCSPHGGGFYREIAWLKIQLPENPPARVQYQASQLTVVEEYRSVTVATSGGTVSIDRTSGEVTVSLQTPTGPFWANGVYKIRA
jgi:hypothetical protein